MRKTFLISLLLTFTSCNSIKNCKIIEFGYLTKNKKEVYSIKELTPKNGFKKLIGKLDFYFSNNNFDYENMEVAYDEPILNYTFEYKSPKNKTIESKISISKSNLSSNIKGLEIIKLLKKEFLE